MATTIELARKAFLPFALVSLAGCLVCMALWMGAGADVTSPAHSASALLALHVGVDAILWLSLTALATMLAVMLDRHRRELPFSWIFGACGVFLIFCGLGYLADIAALWQPVERLALGIRLSAALAAAAAAASLPLLAPKMRVLSDEVRASRRNEQRFLAVTESAFDCFFILDSVRTAEGEILDFRFAFANGNGAGLLSETPETLTGKLLCVTFPNRSADGFFHRCKRVVDTGERLIEELAIRTPTIQAAWLRYQVVRLEDGIAITASDVTQRKRAELELQRVSAFNQAILRSSPFATVVVDLNGRITAFNPSAQRLLQYSEEDVLGKEACAILPCIPDNGFEVADCTDVLHAELAKGRILEGECLFRRKDGSSVPVQLSMAALTDGEGKGIGAVRVFSDITERKRVRESIEHMAHHDALTGLPNRVLLNDRLEHALQVAQRERQTIALLMIDLDEFKHVNDTLGHSGGDALLVAVVARFRSALRSADTLARMGGDEFVVLLERLAGAQDAVTVAENLLASLASPFRLPDHGEEHRNGDSVHQQVKVGASVGICLYPEGAATSSELLIRADTAMYEAKAEGKDRYRIHVQAVGSRA